MLVEARKDRTSNRPSAADTILAITAFADIDYRAKQSRVLALTEEKAALENSSHKRLTLKQQVTSIDIEIDKRNSELDKVKGTIAILENDIKNAQYRLTKLDRILASEVQEDFTLIDMALERLGVSVPVTWHSHAIKDNIVNRELGSGGVLQFVEVGPATWLHSHQLTIKDNVFQRELVERGGALTRLILFNVLFASGKPYRFAGYCDSPV